MIHFIQLFGPSNMSLGCYVIAVWESKGEGIQWSNLGEQLGNCRFPFCGGRHRTGNRTFFIGTPISPSLDLNMSSVFIYFIINTILYHILTRYMDLGILDF